MSLKFTRFLLALVYPAWCLQSIHTREAVLLRKDGIVDHPSMVALDFLVQIVAVVQVCEANNNLEGLIEANTKIKVLVNRGCLCST